MVDALDVRPGVLLGRYECLLPIARGGMASVWAARSRGARGFQKIVAIKTMLPMLSTEPEFERMFLDEARIVSGIHHPNVVEILDLGEESGLLFIVMEWIDGQPLSAIMRSRPSEDRRIPLGLAVRLMIDTCSGLHAAHELKSEDGELVGLVHRDVSPQNILVSYDGVVKVVDFGVAKAAGLSSSETVPGQIKGKIPYMAPEQVAGRTLDRRVDVFSAGVVLYQITTGKHPFRGDNDAATMHNLLNRAPIPPHRIDSRYPRALEAVVLRALAQEPQKRFESAAQMAEALTDLVGSTVERVSTSDVGKMVTRAAGDAGERRKEAIRQALRAADDRLGAAAFTLAESADPVQPTPSSGYTLRPDDAAGSFSDNRVVSGTAERSASSAETRADGSPRKGGLSPRRVSMAVAAALATAGALTIGIATVTSKHEPTDVPVAVQGEEQSAVGSAATPHPQPVSSAEHEGTSLATVLPDAAAPSASAIVAAEVRRAPPVPRLPKAKPPATAQPKPTGEATGRDDSLPPLTDPGF